MGFGNSTDFPNGVLTDSSFAFLFDNFPSSPHKICTVDGPLNSRNCDINGTDYFIDALAACDAVEGQLVLTNLLACTTQLSMSPFLGADWNLKIIPICLPPEPTCASDTKFFDILQTFATVAGVEDFPGGLRKLVNDTLCDVQPGLLATRRDETMTLSLSQRVSGTISLIASIAIIWHVLRSNNGLSTTYHRLVFGLSISDTISSLANALSTTMAPKEMNYLIPFAQGNSATCDTQGFLLILGYMIGALYNCSICFYYLAIIRYDKKDAYIKNK